MYLYLANTKKSASRAHAGLLSALSGRFSLHCRSYKIHRKKWVRLHVVLYKCYHLHKMHRKFIAKNRVVCTCLFSKEIHALLRPQQAGYAAQISITWPGIDVRSSVRPCLGLSWGELVPILSQITASKGFTLRASRGYHTKKCVTRPCRTTCGAEDHTK